MWTVLKDDRFTATFDESERIWTLHEPIPFCWRDVKYEIPAGTKSDLCSIPRVPVLYMLLGGKYNLAGIVHDWLYQVGTVSKDDADRCLYVMIKELSGSSMLATIYYQGVKRFGWKAWKRWRRQNG